MLWACAILDYAAPSCVFAEALAKALLLHWKEIQTRDDSKAKLHAVWLWLRFEQLAQTTLLRLLSEKGDALKEAAALVWGGPSRSQAQLSDALTALGWVHAREHFSLDGLHVDAAPLEAKTTFLFDGPYHYFGGPTAPSSPAAGCSSGGSSRRWSGRCSACRTSSGTPSQQRTRRRRTSGVD